MFVYMFTSYSLKRFPDPFIGKFGEGMDGAFTATALQQLGAAAAAGGSSGLLEDFFFFSLLTLSLTS